MSFLLLPRPLNCRAAYVVCIMSLLVVTGCGDSGDDPLITITAPRNGGSVQAGGTIDLQVRTNDFQLSVPFNQVGNPATSVGSLGRGEGFTLLHHTAEDESEAVDEHSENMVEDSAESVDATHEANESDQDGDSHGHDDGTTNPTARQGHYHVYLDSGTGTDPHLAVWSEQVTITLPSGIAPGEHSLRIELRDDYHVPIGSEHDEFLFFTVS
jgi:hypothetical protein